MRYTGVRPESDRDLHKKHLTIAPNFQPQNGQRFVARDFRDLLDRTDIVTEDKEWSRLIVTTPSMSRSDLELAAFYEAAAECVHDMNWQLSLSVHEVHLGRTIPVVTNAQASLDVMIELYPSEFFNDGVLEAADPWFHIMAQHLHYGSALCTWEPNALNKSILDRLHDGEVHLDKRKAGFEEIWVVTRDGRTSHVEIFAADGE